MAFAIRTHRSLEKNMTLQVRGLTTLRISSKDLKASKNFYAIFFGLSPAENLSNFVSFSIAGATLELVLEDEKSPASKGGSVGYFEVANLDSVLTQAQKLGALVYRGPLKVEETKSIIVQILEPGGTVIGFQEPQAGVRPRSTSGHQECQEGLGESERV